MLTFYDMTIFNKYQITESGVVRDRETLEIIPPIRDSYGRKAVELRLNNRNTRTGKPALALLLLHTFKPMSFKDTMEKIYGVTYHNGDKDDLTLSNLDWDFGNYIPAKRPGVNCPVDEFVPAYGLSSVTVNGLGYIKINGDLRAPFLQLGYMHIYVPECKKEVSVHRLMALTFLQHPIHTEGLVINHIDGNPANNTISNIEWATYSKNLLHAHRTGLRKEAKEILVMDISSRVVTTYPSLGEFCAKVGFDDSVLWDRLRHNRPIYPYEGYYVKYKTDTRPFPAPGFEFDRRDKGISVDVKCIDTGVVTQYSSISKAAAAMGEDVGTVAYQIRQKSMKKVRGYLVRESSDAPWPDPDTLEDIQSADTILAKCSRTGKVLTFASVGKAQRALDPDKLYPSVKSLIATPDSRTVDGYWVRKACGTQIIWPTAVSRPVQSRRILSVVDTRSGEATLYKSARSVGVLLGTDSKTLVSRIQKNNGVWTTGPYEVREL